MRFERVAALAQALLYEGYLLYPYRTSSVKNRQRWMFGSLYPRAFVEEQDEGDGWWTQTECLVRGGEDTSVELQVRFLHLTEPEAVERGVDGPSRRLGALGKSPEAIAFDFSAHEAVSRLRGGLDVAALRLDRDLFRVIIRVANVTPFVMRPSDARDQRRDDALRHAFASTHTLIGVRGGELVSLVDPPASLREAAARCRNVGTWPVLVGDPGARDMMLSAPVILGDYPRVAPESPGDLFDATEIDELLTLRLLTLTDDEKRTMRWGDTRARDLLARTEGLADAELGRLHGVSRTREAVDTRGPALRPGARVRLSPRQGGDIFDLALAGRTATIVSLEQDLEGRVFVAVTVDDDPGRDLGAEGWPGHRFFFRPEELETLP
jgi:hypothetical protein